MNYRHAFHAGNHADVLKHLVLSRIFALLSRKEAPFAYLDSHAGVGLYDLAGDQASRTGEWLQGIARIWQAETRPALLDDYLGVIRSLNRTARCATTRARRNCAAADPRARSAAAQREASRGWRPAQGNMSGDRRVAVHRGEGWHVPRALMPTREKRVVLLIDPPFEQADELSRCVTALKEALGRMRQTIGVIWYPDQGRAPAQTLYQDLARSGAPKLLRAELFVHPADDASRLAGSGLAIVNPPGAGG